MRRHVLTLTRHMFVPLFRAAICPPNSSNGSMNQNIFVFPTRHIQWRYFLLPARRTKSSMMRPGALHIGFLRGVPPARRDLDSDAWAPYLRARSTPCFRPFSVQLFYSYMTSYPIYTGSNDQTTLVLPCGVVMDERGVSQSRLKKVSKCSLATALGVGSGERILKLVTFTGAHV